MRLLWRRTERRTVCEGGASDRWGLLIGGRTKGGMNNKCTPSKPMAVRSASSWRQARPATQREGPRFWAALPPADRLLAGRAFAQACCEYSGMKSAATRCNFMCTRRDFSFAPHKAIRTISAQSRSEGVAMVAPICSLPCRGHARNILCLYGSDAHSAGVETPRLSRRIEQRTISRPAWTDRVAWCLFSASGSERTFPFCEFMRRLTCAAHTEWLL